MSPERISARGYLAKFRDRNVARLAFDRHRQDRAFRPDEGPLDLGGRCSGEIVRPASLNVCDIVDRSDRCCASAELANSANRMTIIVRKNAPNFPSRTCRVDRG